MKSSKKNVSSKAAEELAAIFDSHFAKLAPKERVKREAALDKVVTSIGSRAKPSVHAAPRVSQDRSLRPQER